MRRGEGALPRNPESDLRAVIYCVIPADLASLLHGVLRRHFAGSPGVEVLEGLGISPGAVSVRLHLERAWRDGSPTRSSQTATTAYLLFCARQRAPSQLLAIFLDVVGSRPALDLEVICHS